MKRRYRLLHKWIGLLSCIFMLIVASTAILLNHHDLWFQPRTASHANFDIKKALSIASDPFEPNHLMASDEHHLFETKDQGKNWKEVKLFVPAEQINQIVFSPTTKDLVIVSLKDVGLYLSDDSGEIWEELNTPFNPLEGEKVETMNMGQQHLFVKTNLALYSMETKEQKWSTQIFLTKKQAGFQTKDLIYQLHTGQFFGEWGIVLYDLVSLALIFLSITGLLLSKRYKVTKGKTNQLNSKKILNKSATHKTPQEISS